MGLPAHGGGGVVSRHARVAARIFTPDDGLIGEHSPAQAPFSWCKSPPVHDLPGLAQLPFPGCKSHCMNFVYRPNNLFEKSCCPWACAVALSWVQIALYEFCVRAKQMFLSASSHSC